MTRKIGRGRGLLLILAGLLLVAPAGCDSVAHPATGTRGFSSIVPVSVHPTGGSCQMADTLTFQVVLMANDDRPVKPGDDLLPGDGDLPQVALSDGRIFSFPDQRCEESCPASFECTSSPGGLGDRCSMNADLLIKVEPRFVGHPHSSQAVALMVSNEGRWRGFLPEEVGSSREVNEGGEHIGSTDLTPQQARAGDFNGERFRSLHQIGAVWRDLSRNTESEGREAFLGIWSFSESLSDVNSELLDFTGESVWTDQREQVSEALGNIDPASEATRADIYQSLHEVLRQGFIDSDVGSNAEKRSLILIVGGHDEAREAHAGLEEVIAKANTLGVEISIVQADPPMDESLLRDDFRYYEHQTECFADDECKNFEECRSPQPLEFDSVIYPSNLDANYCLPARDQNGRVGPIADYQRLACETGGAFSYLPVVTNDLLFSRVRGLILEPEGVWEIDVEIPESVELDRGQPFALQGQLDITIGTGNTQGFTFSQDGATRTAGLEGDRDTRPIFFRAD